MNKSEVVIEELLDFIYHSPTSFHTVKNSADILKHNGFSELKANENWYLERNKRYYLNINDSAQIAFVTGSASLDRYGFRIIASHTDSPGFRIKPEPEMLNLKKYLKLNTEVYGSPILNTWLDRPLALAGRLSIATDNPFFPDTKLINVKRPILTIPNLAIHLNRDVNKGVEINKQKGLMPLLAMVTNKFEEKDFLFRFLAKEKDIRIEQIVDYDLFLYEYERGRVMGMNNEFISSSRLDDLALVYASIKALIDVERNKASRVMILFDNEEIGSMTKQGADSPFFTNVLERVAINLGYNREEFFCALSNSFMISADMAHAVHPNYNEKHDPTNKNYLNSGPVIKISANQRYTSDSDSIVVCKELCRRAQIPYQIFVNRSDQRGGSTIGPVSATQLPIRSVDIGNPLLAMHSIRELAGVDDFLNIVKLFNFFYGI
ncbi:M18 family aminopeptidase [Iocasia frigidifontis]|uniref:M18 family aminopeptidase n=1 Tax=Iocasia fonsfrigidae TaxID=2682810 RepID=A0A8A7KA27_9FIRM|nr:MULTISPECIES: M18 family aminopeptidase [Halanaerobiaceae]AZO95154.1 M18 family aminopeptidase [Halocella sp. SP3-1]QTL98090.1 M18 family aminopeptidase [Iocasia fonsfrigidae]